ncbi:Alpha/beta hydrolase family protein [Ceratobasidium theobromae]|uniref:Alpha/beta hydrolase family protein n=1 Tax=Ceratobasidium theobromae TaxID=1582974 RepID=A0A5N5QKS1_9AGAM|nr:Alpha/beta hydrolase family protein [Ceratobasidium theobromae]
MTGPTSRKCMSGTPTVFPKRQLSFYAALFCIVGPVWAVTPMSIFTVGWLAATRPLLSLARWELALFIYCVFETLFCIYHTIIARNLRRKPSALPQYELHHLRSLFTRILQTGLAPHYPDADDDIEDDTAGSRPGSPAESIDKLEWDDPRAVDFRQRLRTWFHKAEWSSISKEAMLSWLSWSCFNAPYEIATQRPANALILQEALDLLEKRAGGKLRPEAELNSLASFSRPVQPLRLTLDPLDVIGRPAICYAITTLANLVYRTYIQREFGVIYGKFGKLEYILRQPSIVTDEAQEPIVFMHGLGIGPAQYSMFISQILRDFPNRPVLVPLQPHISQAIIHPGHLEALGKTELVGTLHGLLEELGWASTDEKSTSCKITFMSHSNGSVPHAWMLKAYPQLLKRNCFVDPVTFCLWEGDVCYNFVYKRPTNQGLDILMRYFVGTELGIANHIQRQFDWSANSLWFEEIPAARDANRAVFFIGGKDSIIDGERVRRYLRSHGVRRGVRFDPEGRHGSALVAGSEGLNGVIGWLRGTDVKK